MATARTDNDTYVAMGIMLRKLLEHQPKFTDDDMDSPHHLSAAQRHIVALREAEEEQRLGSRQREMTPPPESTPSGLQQPLVASAQALDTTAIGSSRKAVTQLMKLVHRVLEFVVPFANALSARLAQVTSATPQRRSASPQRKPQTDAYVQRMDCIIQSLLVYANVSEVLRDEISEMSTLRLFITVCTAARATECRPSSVGLRGLAEIDKLEHFLRSHGIPSTINARITNTFALEMLVDAALPPAVCSSRFEGICESIWDKKAAVVTEAAASRTFAGVIVRGGSYEAMRYLVVMGAYALPRHRIKLYDKLVSEGLVKSFAQCLKVGSVSDIDQVLETLAFVTVPNMLESMNDDCNSPQNLRVSRCSSWAADPCSNVIVERMFQLLSRRVPLPGPHRQKIHEILSNCIRFGGTLLKTVVRCVDELLDQVFFQQTHEVLPIVLELLSVPHAMEFEEEIGHWFEVLSMKVNVSGKRRLKRSEVWMLLPYFSFANTVAALRWRIGVDPFFSRILAVARLIHTNAWHRNLIWSTAASTISLLEPVAASLSRKGKFGTPEGACSRSSRKRPRASFGPLTPNSPAAPSDTGSASPMMGVTSSWSDRVLSLFQRSLSQEQVGAE